MVIAPGAAGKSLFLLQVAVACALGDGRKLGIDVSQQARVLIISGEDRVADYHRRMAALALHSGIDPAALQSLISVFDMTCGMFQLAERRDGSDRREGAHVAELIEHIKSEGFGLVIIDPLVKFHSLSENDNGEMDFVATVIRDLAFEAAFANARRQNDEKAGRVRDAIIDKEDTMLSSLRDQGLLLDQKFRPALDLSRV